MVDTMSTMPSAAGAPDPSGSMGRIHPEARPWTRHAACAGRTSLFFAAPSEGADARAVREAKASRICAVCPVVAPCRTWAREHREYGLWGGESEETRAAAGFRPHPPRIARQPRRANPDRVA